MAETPLAYHRHALTRPTGLRRRLLAELLLQHDDGAVESRLTTRDLVPGQYVAARGGHWLVVRKIDASDGFRPSFALEPHPAYRRRT